MNRIGGKLVLTPPKNGSAREVPLPAVTLRALDDHVAAYGTTPVRCTCCDTVWQVIFTDESGGLINAREFTRDVWRPALAEVGLPLVEANGQHNLRHCFVSRLIFGGASAKDIQVFVGHKKITTTYDVYGHLLKRAEDRARSIIDDAFSADLYRIRTDEAS